MKRFTKHKEQYCYLNHKEGCIYKLFLFIFGVSLCLLCELLPEDRDEPERLELLDAAIPASLHASVTPV